MLHHTTPSRERMAAMRPWPSGLVRFYSKKKNPTGGNSLKLTWLKIGHPKRKGSSSNHPFSGAFTFSFRESISVLSPVSESPCFNGIWISSKTTPPWLARKKITNLLLFTSILCLFLGVNWPSPIPSLIRSLSSHLQKIQPPSPLFQWSISPIYTVHLKAVRNCGLLTSKLKKINLFLRP